MLYYFLRWQIYWGFKVYFSKLYFTNRNRMPGKGPVLLAVNHPTAFLDPILLCAYFLRPIHSILKGNMFSTPLVKWALYSVKTIPIFRLRDGAGFAGLRQNAETMNVVNDRLAGNGMITVLAEGVRKHEKRLRPLQKGCARMAFNYYKKTKKDDLVIVPVGINYTDADEFRSEMMANLGEPLKLRDYIELYKENDRKAVNKLTNDIKLAMRQSIIHIENPEDDEWVNDVLTLQRNSRKKTILPHTINDGTALKEEISITEQINGMEEEEKSAIKDKVEDYINQIKAKGLNDFGLGKPGFYNFLNLLIYILTWIPAKIGYLFNCLPLYLGRYVGVNKTDNVESKVSVQFAVAMVVYTFYWIFWWIAAAIVGKAWFYIWVFFMPWIGWYYLLHTELGKKWNWARLFKKLPKAEQDSLLEKRNKILNSLIINQ